MGNYRVFVEKKLEFQVEANRLLQDYNENFNLNLTSLRVINCYDVYHVTKSELDIIKNHVLSEVVTDIVYDKLDISNKSYFSYEALPGQFDQRADSAIQCSQLLIDNKELVIKSGKIIVFNDLLSLEQLEKIKHYTINPVEMREKDLLKDLSLATQVIKKPVEIHDGFIELTDEDLLSFLKQNEFAMTLSDLKYIKQYFKDVEKRNPSETELKLFDTYWSDHCRHTTFETSLTNISFPKSNFEKVLQETFESYIKSRLLVHGGNKPMTLMDLATIYGKEMRINGELDDLEVSEEVNACSIYIDVIVDGEKEKWLLMFKNETHNHPTEIEPFGGASTCIGGAIRDPLSGRAYVYQAMRVTGAGDITEPIEKTLKGKLPQKTISKKASDGYSSYGNQIGLATTHVREIYHDGYVAKRMEVGAVVGAVKADQIRRSTPLPGDIVILLGGRTGRDGIGGATGSSKEHNVHSIETASAEVQKGNAPIERKIQRLFRNPDVTKLIKKSNDFGAGGVSVAIGELADGLEINLDAIPTKYTGLNATEIALSESQERMAVVVRKEDVEAFSLLAMEENLEATVVAIVTDKNRLVMQSDGINVVDISRNFLNTNGVRQTASVNINDISKDVPFKNYVLGNDLKEKVINHLKDANIASQKGLIEMFDSTIGGSTVLMPFGGKTQLTESDASVQKIPVQNGETTTCSLMSYGFNPKISSWSPFHGAVYAVVESIAKIVAVGGSYENIRLSFQEYFRRLDNNPNNWGLPFSALLGAYYAEKGFNIPAIGGKDSMSGTFHDLHVPPTLISFAVQTEDVNHIISPEFKESGRYVYLFTTKLDDNFLPDCKVLKQNYQMIYNEIGKGNILSAFALKHGGLAEAIVKMTFGNKIGIDINEIVIDQFFDMNYGAIVVESKEKLDYLHAHLIGMTTNEVNIRIGTVCISIDEAIDAWTSRYKKIYPPFIDDTEKAIETPTYIGKKIYTKTKVAKPQVFIPVFPGTNCEYDSIRAFKNAGAKTKTIVFRNQNQNDIKESLEAMVKAIDESQIIMFSGGFSAGDEPDGSGKFITSILMNDQIKNSIERQLSKDGLILGICNGFQALIKSGLLPNGKIGLVNENSPTLVRNTINRHVSKLTTTRVTSTKSPWMMDFKVNDHHHIPISHGEGKFVAPVEVIKELFENGQVATQYIDESGNPTMDGRYNPNGSYYAIEGITSLDGRIFGKMGHSERVRLNLYKNVNGNHLQDIFTSGVKYFKG